jgi:hypothetical protein
MTIYLWGSSDDLIELSGDLIEEYYAPEEEFKVLFSDGTIINGRYDGDWNYHVHNSGKTLICKRFRAGTKEAMKYCEHDYSDVIAIDGNFEWVAIASQMTEVLS